MSPEEKAREMYDSFKKITSQLQGYKAQKVIKQCAIEACYHVQVELEALQGNFVLEIAFWDRVKEEINKIA